MISGELKKLNKVKVAESPETARRKQPKLSVTQNPGHWRVYRRLLDDKSISFDVLKHQAERKEHVEKVQPVEDGVFSYPVFTLPEKDGLRCMCYENVMKVVKTVCRCTPPSLNRETPVKPVSSWTRACKEKYKENQDSQLPLSTVVVRWQLKRGLPKYDFSALKVLFDRYGVIREYRILSPNSAMVVFDELTSACNVINSHSLGEPYNRLHCRWYHRAMENKSVYSVRKRKRIKRDPFLQY